MAARDKQLKWIVKLGADAPLPTNWQLRHDLAGRPEYLEKATGKVRSKPCRLMRYQQTRMVRSFRIAVVARRKQLACLVNHVYAFHPE